MAKKTPIDGKIQKRLDALEIEAENQEEAKEIILQKLKDADYEGFDDEPLDALIDIYEATAEPEEAPAPKTKKKPAPVEVDEEEEEEVVAPKPKTKKKPAPVEVDEEEEALAEEVAKNKPAKSVPKPATERKARNSNAFDKGNAEHIATVTKVLQKIFSKAEYAINAITSGVSVRLMGDNVKIVLIKFNNITFGTDGKTFIGDVNFKKITNVEELEGLIPEDFSEKVVEKVEARGYCKVCDVSGKEFVEMFGDDALFTAITKKGKSIDKKMGSNREKLSESLATTAKPKLKRVEVDEEEEEEVVAPKPKTKKKPVPAEPEEEEEEAPAPKPKTKAKPAPVVEEEEEEEEEAPAPKPKAKAKK